MILAICKLEEGLIKKYSDVLTYLPLSNEETDSSWQALIKTHCPKAIIFGLQTINQEKLSFWRWCQPDDTLQFVRKGTSLHRVDFASAEKYRIAVHNTAGVNAQFVAQFIVDTLIDQSDTVGILGVGAIGKKTASMLLAKHKKLILFNRTDHSLEGSQYRYTDLMYLFTNAPEIAICLPLTQETTGLVTEKMVNTIPQNSQISCISPPRVLSKEAIIALDKRSDLRVTFDHVASGLGFIHESLGRTSLRDNFIFEEKAAAGHDCQYAMGEAAILRILRDQ